METENQTPKLKLIEDGDWELWLVEGFLPDGFKWTIPIKAKPWILPDKKRVFCIPDCELYTKAQHDVLDPLLDAWDCEPSNEKDWWIEESKLAGMAFRTPGMTMEYWVRWPGYEYEPGTEDEREWYDDRLTPDTVNFLKYVHKMSGEPSYEKLKLIWLTIQHWAAQWLAVDHRVLDLGFVKLIPIPYRANWKEMLAIGYSKILFAFNRGTEERDKILSGSGFYNTLATMNLLAVHPHKNVAIWSVECLISYKLERQMIVREMNQKGAIGSVAYGQRVLRLIGKQFKYVMEVFEAYVGRISYPDGKPSMAQRASTPIIMPNIKNTRVTTKPIVAGDSIDVSVSDPFSEWHESDLFPKKPKEADDKLLPQNLFKRLGRIKPANQLLENNDETFIELPDH